MPSKGLLSGHLSYSLILIESSLEIIGFVPYIEYTNIFIVSEKSTKMSHWNFHTKNNCLFPSSEMKNPGDFFSEGTKKPRENGEGIQYRSKGIFISF